MKVADARQQYVQWIQYTTTLSPHTVRAYHSDILAFERCVGPQIRSDRSEVQQISPDLLIGFVSSQLRAGTAPATLIRRCSGLRGFSKWLLKGGLIESDPWSVVKLEIRRGKSLPRAVAAHDLARLLSRLESEAEPRGGQRRGGLDLASRTTLVATVLMLATGVRVGELVSLRLIDVDAESRTVRVLGKGRRERQVYLPPGRLTNSVTDYVRDRLALEVAHDRLLVNAVGSPLSAAAVRSRLARAGRNAAMSCHLTPHMLRHSAATQLIEAGVDIRFVQRLLGHASLATTELYTHVSDAALRRAVGEADVLGRIDRR